MEFYKNIQKNKEYPAARDGRKLDLFGKPIKIKVLHLEQKYPECTENKKAQVMIWPT